MTDLDLDFVRSQFPALNASETREWRFFENAGGSYPCDHTIERLSRFYRETKVQPYGAFEPSRRGGHLMDEARARWAAYLGVDAAEVHFGPSTTQNTYVLAHAFRPMWTTGDEVVVTNQDHEANIGAWRRLAATGIHVREWSVDPETGELNLADLEALLGPKTRLVACTHCSNVIADPNPIPEIAERVHEAGATLVVDGVAYAPHALPDVSAIGADVYLFSLYKVYGPHQGLMYVASDTMRQLTNQSHFFNDGIASKRLVPAGPDHAQVAAASGTLDYFDALDAHHFSAPADAPRRRERLGTLMRSAERRLLEPLLSFLRDRSVRVLGPTDPDRRLPTVALDTAKAPAELAEALAAMKVAAGASHFYAPRVLERMGVDADRGVLRLSFVHYTTPDDIDALLNALDRLL